MRALAAVLVLLLLAFPGAAAEPLASDPEGDVVYDAAAPGFASPPLPLGAATSSPAVDLLTLSLVERDDSLLLTFGVASLEGGGVATFFDLDLGWGTTDFRLAAGYLRSEITGQDERAWASLFRVTDDEWEWVARLSTPMVDVGAGTLAIELPKVYLVSHEGVMPGRGEVLELRTLRSQGGTDLPFARLRARDVMPDDGEAAAVVLERGDFTQGKLIVTAPDRVRVSNGGATTFVYHVQIRNTGEIEEEYALGIADAPAGWDARIRSPVKVPPQSERTVSLLVSVPFEHEHGGFSALNLTVQGTRDPASAARMRLGVLHTPIPQPAGHHAELYLHARERDVGPVLDPLNELFPLAWGWMNTESDHEGDAAFVSSQHEGDRASWWVPLDPALQLGLDFDIERTGAIAASILAKRDAEVQARASLYYTYREGEEREVVKLAESDATPVRLTRDTPSPLALVLTPTPASDYVPYRSRSSMYLELSIDAGPTEGIRYASLLDPQLLVEDFVMELPLNEYHDRLTGAAEAEQGLAIEATGPVEKVGLPGSVLTYTFRVKNGGPADVFVFDVAGNDAQEGVLVPRGEIRLDANETREVTLAVEIPVTANPEQEFEVLLFVHALDDPSKMAIARTKTRATHDAEQAQPDEARLLLDARARESEVPGVGAFALVAILALLALTSSPTRRSRPPPRRR